MSRKVGWMDRLGDVAGSITDTLTLELVGEDGSSCPLLTDLQYDVSDPYAVTAVFRTDGQAVRWTFGRCLLLGGMYAPAGDGDVHVWPSLDAAGNTIVMIELCSPNGQVLVQAPMRKLSAFVSRTVGLVPPGTESDHLDLDDSLRSFFAGEG